MSGTRTRTLRGETLYLPWSLVSADADTRLCSADRYITAEQVVTGAHLFNFLSYKETQWQASSLKQELEQETIEGTRTGE